MKKIILTIGAFFCAFNIFAQDIIPSYPEVLRTFFSKYIVKNETEEFLSFAKKKDGWFIQKLNRLKNDTVLSEDLFWSGKAKTYSDMSGKFKKQETQDETENNIKNYLVGNAAYLWNDYERCRYHGYSGWQEDMIADFSAQLQLQDTLLEGLSRAYSSMANRYLWYQQGGVNLGEDTMQIKLKRMQLPSQDRIDKVIFFITKSIETYDKLIKQNPSYSTFVGNVSLKKFNQYLFGYIQMSIAMRDDQAKIFINKAELGDPYIRQAKNYLNSCDKGAILFTYGDNDTYQLWYVQEKENFRQDVVVINTSLLGLPAYVDMLRRKRAVAFSATPLFYEPSGSDLTYFQEVDGTPKNTELALNDFLNNTYLRKESVETTNMEGSPQVNSTYSINNINLSINSDSFNKISTIKTTTNKIAFKLKNYLYIHDVIEFDIINENINKRPIYFTSSAPGYFDSNLIQQGVVFRLFPFNNTNKERILKAEIKSLEIFADSIYQPIISFNLNGVKNKSEDGSNVFFQLYSRIADYYSDINDFKKTVLWLSKASKYLPEITKENMPAGYLLANAYLKTGKEKFKKIMESYGEYLYDKYAYPSAINGFLSKKECLQHLTALDNYLRQEKTESLIIDSLIEKLADK